MELILIVLLFFTSFSFLASTSASKEDEIIEFMENNWMFGFPKKRSPVAPTSVDTEYLEDETIKNMEKWWMFGIPKRKSHVAPVVTENLDNEIIENMENSWMYGFSNRGLPVAPIPERTDNLQNKEIKSTKNGWFYGFFNRGLPVTPISVQTEQLNDETIERMENSWMYGFPNSGFHLASIPENAEYLDEKKIENMENSWMYGFPKKDLPLNFVPKDIETNWMFGFPNSNLVTMDKAKSCNCRLGSNQRIVGGDFAKPNSIPWQVSLADKKSNEHFCGGIIINHNYVLTTAICANTIPANEIKVRVGLHRLMDENIANTYYVEKIYHQKISKVYEPGNIALLRLKKPIDFITGKVEPACLNFDKRTFDNEVMASGWGQTFKSRRDVLRGDSGFDLPSPILKEAYFKVYTEKCNQQFICVNSEKQDSICFGDLGGPLHYTVNGTTTVEGVASLIGAKTLRFDTIKTMCTGRSAFSKLSTFKKWLYFIFRDDYCSL